MGESFEFLGKIAMSNVKEWVIFGRKINTFLAFSEIIPNNSINEWVKMTVLDLKENSYYVQNGVNVSFSGLKSTFDKQKLLISRVPKFTYCSC